MHHDRPAQHALRPDQLDQLVRHGTRGVALAVRLEVAEVADVTLAVGGGAVRLLVRVDWISRWLDLVSEGGSMGEVWSL